LWQGERARQKRGGKTTLKGDAGGRFFRDNYFEGKGEKRGKNKGGEGNWLRTSEGKQHEKGKKNGRKSGETLAIDMESPKKPFKMSMREGKKNAPD